MDKEIVRGIYEPVRIGLTIDSDDKPLWSVDIGDPEHPTLVANGRTLEVAAKKAVTIVRQHLTD